MSGTDSTRRALRAGVATSLAVLLGAATAWSAAADPNPVYPSQSQVDQAKSAVTSTAQRVAQLDAQFAASSARLTQVRERAAAAAEAWNGARIALERAAAEAKAAQKRAAAAKAGADAASQQVRRYAASVYQAGGSLGELDAYLSSTGPQDLLDRATAMEAVSNARAEALQKAAASSVVARTMADQAKAAKAAQAKAAADAQRARDEAQASADQAQAEAARIEQQQRSLTTQLAALRKTSATLERRRQEGLAAAAAARAAAAERARLAAAQAARDAAARAAAARAAARRAAQQATTQSAPEAAPEPAPAPPPPTKGGVSAVLDYARAQVGKPYEWGAAGPDSFDCSGLTMMAWRQAGVYLSHYTGFQYEETARVAIKDLRPGDLVFFGDSGPTSHHMGLYVGNGQMIEAPYTGANVRYGSIYRSDLIPYGGRP